jgi:transcriptional regulator with XRE-family HTH domain
MPTSGSPTVRRRRLATELRRLRESAGGDQAQTMAKVARALRWSPSKISRYELGRTGLNPDEVQKLLDFYGVAEPERGQLLALAHDAAQKGWWEEYADALPEEYSEFIGLEAEATSIEQWQVEAIPGLLQTEQYARQVHLGYQRVAPIPPSTVERRVKVRMIRQEALTRDPPLKLHVVVDESVLFRRIGDHSVMYAQLQRLAQAADLPNVTLQILPLSRDHSLLVDSFVILRFGSATGTMLHDVVSQEHLVRSEFSIEGEGDTYLQRLAFKSLAEESLTPPESRDLITQIAQRTWS